jgi:TPR repeat protein
MASDDNPRIKVALAQALRPEQRPEEVALLRAAAAQGDAAANFLLWDSHRSWDQQFDPAPLISRAESAQALRKAAELNYPAAMFRLAMLLDSGGVVKRDAAEARYWAERALANPPKDVGRDTITKFCGRLLAASDKPDERARGLAVLDQLSRAGAFGAKSALAEAIRRDDPVRARTLLEEAKGPDPGGAIPALADMLNKGEGGPADPQRAWKLLQGHNDIGAIEGMRGQFYLDGKQVPRDVAKAIELIRHAGVWDYAPQLQVVQLLAANPSVRIERPEQLLYHAVEAAELDEPGAMAALINLKLSQHPQFRDRQGGCKLLQAAATRGDQVAPEQLSECRAN